MYPDSIEQAMEAAEVFTRVADARLAGHHDAAADTLNAFMRHDCDTDKHECEAAAWRLCYLVTSGAMVTADALRCQNHPQPGGFWGLVPLMGTVDDAPPCDLAAMRVLTAELNHDHAAVVDVMNAFCAEHGIVGVVGLLAAMFGIYSATVIAP